MKLLIVTQKVDENDDILGFFISWIKEFARQCEIVEVVCLFEGEHHLPVNVRVHSLGKDRGTSKLIQLVKFFYFKFFLKYEAVFVHMNPIYVCLAGDWWRLTGKKIVLSYIHRNVDLKLRIAEKFANVIVSASESSFRLPTEKLRIIGHGIDSKQFENPGIAKDKPPVIVMVGRISRIKNIDLAIEAAKLLKQKGVAFKLRLIGAPARQEDTEYLEELKKKVGNFDLASKIEFVGSIPNNSIASEYHKATVSINNSPTGGIDKSVLESIAAGTPAISTNQGFKEYFGKYSSELIATADPAALADKLEQFLSRPQDKEMTLYLQAQVREKASLEKLVTKIIGHLQ